MIVSDSLGLKRKSGPKTRLLPPPWISLSVTRKEANERPRSCRTRPTRSSEEKSWSARSEPFGPRQDHAAAPAVVRHEGRPARRVELPGPSQAPAGRGDGPGVDGRHGRREEVDPLEEERPLLGVEEREPLVDPDLRDVRLDLGEVGVDRAVESDRRRGGPLQVEAGVERRRLAHEPLTVLAGDRLLRRRRVGSRHEVPPGRKAREAAEDVLGADEAVPAPGELRREHLVAEVSRPVPVDEDPPGLGVLPLVAQRGERDPDLEVPARRRDPPRRVPEKVGRRALVAVVGDGVVRDAAGVREEEDRRPPVVPGVEDDPAVVRLAAQGVALREGGPDLGRLRVVALEGRVEEPVVVGEPGHGPHLGRDVVARVRLVERLDPGRPGPAGVAEVSVDRDGARSPRDPDLGAPQVVGGGGATKRRAGHEDQPGEEEEGTAGCHPSLDTNGRGAGFTPRPTLPGRSGPPAYSGRFGSSASFRAFRRSPPSFAIARYHSSR